MPKKAKGAMHYGPTSRNVSGMMGKGVTKGMGSKQMHYPSAKGAKSGSVMKGNSGKGMGKY